MKTKKIVISIALVILIIVVSSCSFAPSAITNLFATKTSTATPTSTSTPTATSTPKPPLFVSACDFAEECPGVISARDLIGDSLQHNVVNEVQIPYSQTIWINTDWIAKDQSTLDANLAHIHWFVKIDGQNYFQDSWLESGTVQDSNDSSITYPGMWLGVSLSGWKLGESHQIDIGFTLDSAINDGWSDYAADYVMLDSFKLDPADLPTPTETSTATLTPTVTNTPRPVVIYPTATKRPFIPTATQGQALANDITLRVKNQCSDAHKVIFSGPKTVKYSVPAGQTVEYQVPHGTYTWIIDNTWTGGPQELTVDVWTLTLCN